MASIEGAVTKGRTLTVASAAWFVTRPLALIRRLTVSSPGNGVRGYGEGDRTIEQYQVMAGRKDRFDWPLGWVGPKGANDRPRDR